MNPRRSFANALKWAFVMNSGRRAMATVFTFLLAALLGPHDFGLVAVALVYVAFIRMLLEQGFTTAIIQREDLRPEHLDSTFWLNLAWCVVLTVVSVATAGWWAAANDMPELEYVIYALSVLILFEGLQIVQQALMERALDFKRLAVRANAAVLLGGLVGIPLALRGAGVWALVAQQVVSELTLLVLVWVMCTWRPRLRFSPGDVRELLGFSANVFAANVAGFLNRRADALFMGLFFGPVAVGLYRLADRLVDVVLEVTMRPVGAVSLPVLSRLQNDPEGLRKAVAKCLHTTLLATVPILLVVVAVSDEITAVLGPEWTAAAVPLQLLCLVGIGKAISFFTGPVLFAVSRPRFRAVMLWILAVVSTVSVLVVGAALAGASIVDQVTGMALSRAILFLPILIPVNLLIVQRMTGLRLRGLARFVPAPVVSGLAAIGAAAALRASGAVDGLAPFATLMVVGTLATLTAALVLVALDRTVRDYVRLVERKLRSRGAGPTGPSGGALPGGSGRPEAIAPPAFDRARDIAVVEEAPRG